MIRLRLVLISALAAMSLLFAGPTMAACVVVGTGTPSNLETGDVVTCTGTVAPLATNNAVSNVTATIGDSSTPTDINATVVGGVLFSDVTGGAITVTNQATVHSDNAGIFLSGGGTNSLTVNQGAIVSSVGNGTTAVNLDNSDNNTVTLAGTIGSVGAGATGVSVVGTSTGNVVTVAATGIVQSGDAVAFQVNFGGNTIINNGTISSDPNYAVVMSNGADRFVNAGSISSNFGTTVDLKDGADTFEVQAGSSITGSVNGGDGTDTLTFGGDSDSSFDLGDFGAGQQFFAFEKLSKEGSSTWTLTGTTVDAAGLDVNEGTVLIDGSMANVEVGVYDGGTLGGTGTIGSAGVQSGGTLAPGNSIGTLNVDGIFAFNGGSTYEVEVNAAGESDLLLVTGMASISMGAAVKVVAFPDYALGQAYTIVTAAGGLSGTFDSVTFSLLFVTPELTYDANNVYVTLTQTANLKDWAVTPNQLAAAGAVDGLGAGNDIFDAAILLGSADAAQAAFDALSGEGHATLKGVFVEQSGAVRDAVFGRLDTAFAAPDAQGAASGYAGAPMLAGDGAGGQLWSEFYAGLGILSGDGNAASSPSASGGLTLGADGEVGDWRLGFVAHAGLTGLSIPDRGTSGNSTDYGLGLYGGAKWGDTGFVFGADYSRHTISTTRQVAFPGLSETLRAGYGAGTGQVFGEINHEFDLGSLALTPFVQAAYVNHATDAFTETGGVAALSNAASTTNATFTTLGLRGSQQMIVGADGLATFSGGAAWRHAFASLPTAEASFAGGGSFSVSGTPIAADALVLDAGIDLDLASGLDLSLVYGGQLSSAGQAHTLKAGVGGSF